RRARRQEHLGKADPGAREDGRGPCGANGATRAESSNVSRHSSNVGLPFAHDRYPTAKQSHAAPGGSFVMSTVRGTLLAALIGVLSVIAIVLAPGSVPPSAPMVAALVAAALCSFRQTVVFAV